VLVVALLGAVLYYFQSAEQAEPPPATPPDPAELVTAPPPVRHPLPEVARVPTPPDQQAQPAPEQPPVEAQPPVLPELDASDALLHGELARLSAGQRLGDQLRLDGMVRRFVVTIDNLTGSKLPRKQLSTQGVDGRFSVSGEADSLYLSPANFSRYTPMLQFLESIDSDKLVQLYVRVYPLFQQAYEELGYPSRYFNDRLVEVIDHLLGAPDANEAPRLVRKGGLYQFADPQLEALSAGQKVLIRVGPDNAARIKLKLRELRESLVSASAAARRDGVAEN
jgi:hypothetical protein